MKQISIKQEEEKALNSLLLSFLQQGKSESTHFNHIRKIFNIDNEEYINSIGPNKLMTSLMMG